MIEQLLMCGFDGLDGVDIPDGSVIGYPAELSHQFDKVYIDVGAEKARREFE